MSQPSTASHPIHDDSSSESSGFDDGISDHEGVAAVASIVEEDNNNDDDSDSPEMERSEGRRNWIPKSDWVSRQRLAKEEWARKQRLAERKEEEDDDEDEEEDSDTDHVEDMLLNMPHTKRDDKEEVEDEAEEEDIAALGGEEKAKAKKKPQRGRRGGRSKRGAITKKKKKSDNEIPQVGTRPVIPALPDLLPEPTKKDHYKGEIKKNGTGEDIKKMANARIHLLESLLRQHVANGKLIYQTAENGLSGVEEYMDQSEERMKYLEGRIESLNGEVGELRVLLAELEATNAGLEDRVTFLKELGKAQKSNHGKTNKRIATLESENKRLKKELNSVENDEHKVEMVQKISDIKTNAAIAKKQADADIKRQEKEEDKKRKNESFEQILSAHNNPSFSQGDGAFNQQFFRGGGGGGRSWNRGSEYYDEVDYDCGADYNYYNVSYLSIFHVICQRP